MKNRRQALTVGALASVGLTLPTVLAAGDRRDATGKRNSVPAKSCILFFMEGGASHIDLWDLKPDAPSQIRGEYRPIATSLPGFQVCEKLPMWVPIARHLTVVRSVTHTIVDHNASSYYGLTGHYPMRGSELIRAPSREDAPPVGSVLAKLRPTGQPLPDFVHIPKRMINCGSFIPAQLSGFLGEGFDPLITGDPSAPDFKIPGLAPQAELTRQRLEDRKSLLERVRLTDPVVGYVNSARLHEHYERAFSLVTSEKARRAFDISSEPERVRHRYGADQEFIGKGGRLAHLGSSLLLARRLIEAGVRLVTVWAGSQAFDTHREHYATLNNSLCPVLDRAFSALIEDLAERSMLSETLVVAVSEFGRTPKLGQVTSSAGATPDGRDHWPQCFSAILAGGGMRAGYLHGASDRHAALPIDQPVRPSDITATIYAAMGLDPSQRLLDSLNRPHALADGTVLEALFA